MSDWSLHRRCADSGKVTVIDRNHRVIQDEDDDITGGLQSLFQDEGVELV